MDSHHLQTHIYSTGISWTGRDFIYFRGSFSVEVILTLLAWKVANPSCMHLTRGNHESRNMTKLYGYRIIYIFGFLLFFFYFLGFMVINLNLVSREKWFINTIQKFMSLSWQLSKNYL